MRELWISVDKYSNIPLHVQVSEAIKLIISKEMIGTGDAIPSSRLLAEQLDISRTVVLQAYEQLQAEGFLTMKRGAGTFVTNPFEHHGGPDVAAAIETEISYDDFTRIPTIADNVHFPIEDQDERSQQTIIDFRHGIPAWGTFPMDKWKKALMEACHMATPETLSYGSAAGSQALLEEIARLVRATRSIPAMPEQIVITTGATQALDILARMFLTKGEQVLVEDPTHPVLREIFAYSGAEVIPVQVDQEGFCVKQLSEYRKKGKSSTKHKTPKLVYVTPSHQFPLGETMSLKRRVELLGWARQTGAIIIEDDYDSEYRYVGQKVSALAGLDSAGRVIYVGSFSKTLFPALRIGYAILPPALIEPFLAIKCITDRMTPTIEQEALAEFIRGGQFAKHVHTMGKLYASRRKSLVSALEKHFGGRARCFGDEAGLHMLIEMDTRASEGDIAERAKGYGVKVYPASGYYIKNKPSNATFLLGYANLSETDIYSGIKLVARAEKELTSGEAGDAGKHTATIKRLK
ncbi:PLP-dependent aminotransferase family protein [Paenibacillus sp. GCM10027627]|uniref:MocR-like pyridoxine biosynthesis transcription factor PdxR n=1 Tax=unclassified Paenibacillus TaxID=185978 RepID=UPI003630F4A8